jgi:hypothetical protein
MDSWALFQLAELFRLKNSYLEMSSSDSFKKKIIA